MGKHDSNRTNNWQKSSIIETARNPTGKNPSGDNEDAKFQRTDRTDGFTNEHCGGSHGQFDTNSQNAIERDIKFIRNKFIEIKIWVRTKNRIKNWQINTKSRLKNRRRSNGCVKRKHSGDEFEAITSCVRSESMYSYGWTNMCKIGWRYCL